MVYLVLIELHKMNLAEAMKDLQAGNIGGSKTPMPVAQDICIKIRGLSMCVM